MGGAGEATYEAREDAGGCARGVIKQKRIRCGVHSKLKGMDLIAIIRSVLLCSKHTLMFNFSLSFPFLSSLRLLRQP